MRQDREDKNSYFHFENDEEHNGLFAASLVRSWKKNAPEPSPRSLPLSRSLGLAVTYPVAGRTRRSASAWPPGGKRRSRPSPAERGRQGSGSPAGRETQMFPYKKKLFDYFTFNLKKPLKFLTRRETTNGCREIKPTVRSSFSPQSFTSPFLDSSFIFLLTSLAVSPTQTVTNRFETTLA